MLSLKARRHAISALEEVRRQNAPYWASPRNDMARGIYGEAMRAKQSLLGASDEHIEAEILGLQLERTSARYQPG